MSNADPKHHARNARLAVLALGLWAGGQAMAAADPSLGEVYSAAHGGHLAQAQSLMSQLLRDHPRSARAHFVEAELLARQGEIPAARSELGRAEQLAPGLPFAQARSVLQLRHELDAGSAMQAYAPARRGLLWGVFAALGGGALLAWLLTRPGSARRTMPAESPFGAGGPSGWMPPGAAAYPRACPPAAAAGGGLGSTVAGGLATGLAVGAGAMAAEAIGQRLFGSAPSVAAPWPTTPSFNAPALDPDLGGQDFGVDPAAGWGPEGGFDIDSGDGWDL